MNDEHLAVASTPSRSLTEATPRTDDKAFDHDSWGYTTKPNGQFVEADFARELERELAARWKPIETAPHSGIGVLLLQPWRSGHDTVLIGHYANGWVNRDCEELTPKPTHWMPLPQPINGYPYTTHEPERAVTDGREKAGVEAEAKSTNAVRRTP